MAIVQGTFNPANSEQLATLRTAMFQRYAQQLVPSDTLQFWLQELDAHPERFAEGGDLANITAMLVPSLTTAPSAPTATQPVPAPVQPPPPPPTPQPPAQPPAATTTPIPQGTVGHGFAGLAPNQVTLTDVQSPFYSQQGPEQAFIRYLSGLEQQAGRSFTEPVRGLLSERAGTLANIAPFYGYGVPVEQGGSGADFAEFFRRASGGGGNVPTLGLPSFADRQSLLRNIASATGTPEVSRTPQQASIADLFGNIEQPHSWVANLLTAGINPYVRGALAGGLRRRFQTAEALRPEESFLNYLQSQGVF